MTVISPINPPEAKAQETKTHASVAQPVAAPTQPPHSIATEAEALEIAQRLAAQWAPSAHERDRDRRLPWAEMEDYSASGLWAITVPTTYGGLGASAWTLAQVIATIAAADGSLGHIPQNHFYALEVLRVGGTDAQKRFFYDRVLAGERFGNALSEISHRDHKRRTRLEPKDGQWVLNGQKFYCTGAIFAHWIPVQAMQWRDGADEPISVLVFVPRAAAGVTVIDDWDGMGQRVTGSGSVALENVAIDPAWIVPFQTSFDSPTTIGPLAQIMHAAIDLGVGEGAFAAMLPYVREHTRPWVDAGIDSASLDPLTLHAIGNIDVRLYAARLLLRRSGAVVDAAQANPTDATVAAASIAVAEARTLTHSAGLLAADKLLELGGTSSTFADRGFDVYWRNVRTHTLHDPVRWKFNAIGNYVLNGINPPRYGAL